jgi:uncharacterized protein (TIGR00297 family)
MHKDSVIITIVGIIVLLASILLEMFARNGRLPQWISRKLLHIIAVSSCALLPLYLEQLETLQWIVGIAECLLLFFVGKGYLFKEESGRKSWGIALFPIPYFLLLMFCDQQRGLIALPMLILAWSDALAAISGKLFAKKFFTLSGDAKSIIGSFTCVGITFSLLLLARLDLLPFALNWGIYPLLPFCLFALAFSLIIAAVEALGSQGWDNFYIPVAALLLLNRLPFIVQQLPSFTVLIAFSILFIYLSIQRKMLSPGGAFTAALMGISVAVFAGFEFLILPFFFFLSSSLLGKIARSKTLQSDRKQGKARDAIQVICNGGIYWILALLLPFYPSLNVILLLSMAIACSDTWASEIGIRLKGTTYDCLRWKKLPPGISGGISLYGSLAGLIAAFSIVVLAHFCVVEINLATGVLLMLLGFSGMLLDSIIGALFQARFKNSAGLSDDDTGKNVKLISGYRWMTNDLVNLSSNLIVCLIYFIFWS